MAERFQNVLDKRATHYVRLHLSPERTVKHESVGVALLLREQFE